MNAPSSPYRIFETRPFLDDLKGVPHPHGAKIVEKLKNHIYPQLKQQPYYGPNIKKLYNWEPDTWRYRIGSWRVFYEINEPEHVVFLTAIDLRRDAYSR